MKCTVERLRLLSLLDNCRRVMPARSAYPVLRNVRLEVVGAALSVAATDLDVYVRYDTSVEQAEPGVAVVSEACLRDVLEAINAASVDMFSNGKDLGLRAPQGRYQLEGIEPAEYPEAPGPVVGSTWRVWLEQLRGMYEAVSFCASRDESRPAMAGICVEFAAESGATVGARDIRMVATDGYRLALFNCQRDFRQTARLIVSKKLFDFLPITDEYASVATDSCRMSVTAPGMHVVARLIEGPYPDYWSCLKWDNPNVLRCDRNGLSEVLKHMVKLWQSIPGGTVAFLLGIGATEVYTQVPTALWAREPVVPSQYNGASLRVGLNPGYLVEILSHVPSQVVAMKFGTPLDGVLIEGDWPPADIAFLMMPIKDPPVPDAAQANEMPSSESEPRYAPMSPALGAEFRKAVQNGAVEPPQNPDEISFPGTLNLRDEELKQVMEASLDVAEQAKAEGVDLKDPKSEAWVRAVFHEALGRHSSQQEP